MNDYWRKNLTNISRFEQTFMLGRVFILGHLTFIRAAQNRYPAVCNKGIISSYIRRRCNNIVETPSIRGLGKLKISIQIRKWLLPSTTNNHKQELSLSIPSFRNNKIMWIKSCDHAKLKVRQYWLIRKVILDVGLLRMRQWKELSTSVAARREKRWFVSGPSTKC